MHSKRQQLPFAKTTVKHFLEVWNTTMKIFWRADKNTGQYAALSASSFAPTFSLS